MIWLGLILTFARSAILGAMISLIIFLWQKKYKKFLAKILGIIILILLLFTFFPNRFYALHKNFLDLWIKRTSISYRLERFPTVFKMLKEHPFTGVGIENFRYLFDKYHAQQNIPYEFKIPDNMYLMLLAETGLIGFIAFLYFLFNLLRKSLKAMADEENGQFLRLCICGFFGLLFNMFSYDLFYWNMPFCFFWMYAGIIKSYSDLQNEKN
ncbi:MAG: O-antigen ligase family protein [Candidatus Omnitrophota bacterium]